MMNLYFRLLWTILRALRLPKMAMDDSFERVFRVLPNDIDINLHMNNGRYLTVADLMIIEFFARIGFFKVLLKNGWRPVAGGTIMSYRKQLKLGQKYRLRYRWTGCDEHWNYFSVEFLTLEGVICAKGISKGATVSSTGLVPIERSFDALGYEPMSDDLPEAVIHWKESERLLMAWSK